MFAVLMEKTATPKVRGENSRSRRGNLVKNSKGWKIYRKDHGGKVLSAIKRDGLVRSFQNPNVESRSPFSSFSFVVQPENSISSLTGVLAARS